jgi:hypothetical protein
MGFKRNKLMEYLPTIFPMLHVLSNATKQQLFLMMEISLIQPNCLVAEEGIISKKFYMCLDGNINSYRKIGNEINKKKFNGLHSKRASYP